MIVPLVDSEFNRAKSNIAWLEGTYAGAAVVARSLPEFGVPGCIHYEDPKEFSNVVRDALASSERRKSAVRKSWSHISKAGLHLSDVNHIRQEVLNDLIS